MSFFSHFNTDGQSSCLLLSQSAFLLIDLMREQFTQLSSRSLNNEWMMILWMWLWMKQRMKRFLWWQGMNEGEGMWWSLSINHEWEMICDDLWMMGWGKWEFLEVCDVIKHCFREGCERVFTQFMKMRRRKREVTEWRMGKGRESCERSEQIWRNRFKFVFWNIQWKWMKMMKKWRCVLLNEVSFVRDEKRESGREVREFK